MFSIKKSHESFCITTDTAILLERKPNEEMELILYDFTDMIFSDAIPGNGRSKNIIKDDWTMFNQALII